MLAVSFTERAAEDYDHWERSDRRILDKIKALLREARETPLAGTGHPEPLKHEFSGCWSRRITKEHRLVYRVDGDTLVVLQCRFHY